MEYPDRIIPEGGEKTLRPMNPGAEKWLCRPIKCLDHGFVYLVDYMGNDTSIAEAARVSYGQGTKKVSEDRGLIRYLRRNSHTTPLEMVEFKFHCKMPIFVARQWIRHRTANVNEYSGRYSVMSNEFYVPEPSALATQSDSNRQGRGETLSPAIQKEVLELLKAEYIAQYGLYEKFLKFNLARELARIGLSVANYTEWYWKIDVHNLFHFLRLRLDKHAQYEIRVFGEAMANIVKESLPISFEAFEDYQLYAMNLSRLEIDFIKSNSWPMEEATASAEIAKSFKNKRETSEFVEKLKKLNFIKLLKKDDPPA